MKKKIKIYTKTKSRGKKLLKQEEDFASKVKPLRKKDKDIKKLIENLLTKFWN
jgi:hypothetical protein